MKLHDLSSILLLAIVCFTSSGVVKADVFNMPSGQKSLELVTVGDPGNAGDRGGPNGAVSHTFQMGKYEVTKAQYCEFLNAVARADTYGLYDSNMATDIPPSSGITQSGSPGNYVYALTPGRENFPVNWISWADAARFCNWLQNGQPTGAQGPGTTETGAYTLNGANTYFTLRYLQRTAAAQYWIPSYDEWYKAAYYRGGGTAAGYWAFPTQSDVVPSNTLPDSGNHANFTELFGPRTDPTNGLTPVGEFLFSASPYGTFDQAGNVYEWHDITTHVHGDVGELMLAALVGGSYNTPSSAFCATTSIHVEQLDTMLEGAISSGFRVAAAENVPEPSNLLLLLTGGAMLFGRSLRRKHGRRARPR